MSVPSLKGIVVEIFTLKMQIIYLFIYLILNTRNHARTAFHAWIKKSQIKIRGRDGTNWMYSGEGFWYFQFSIIGDLYTVHFNTNNWHVFVADASKFQIISAKGTCNARLQVILCFRACAHLTIYFECQHLFFQLFWMRRDCLQDDTMSGTPRAKAAVHYLIVVLIQHDDNLSHVVEFRDSTEVIHGTLPLLVLLLLSQTHRHRKPRVNFFPCLRNMQ